MGRRQVHQKRPADGVISLEYSVEHLQPLFGRGIGLRHPGQENPSLGGARPIAELAAGVSVRQARQHQSGCANTLRTPGKQFERPQQVGQVFPGVKEARVAAKQRIQGLGV